MQPEQALLNTFSRFLEENPPVLFGNDGDYARSYGHFLATLEELSGLCGAPEAKCFISRIVAAVNDAYCPPPRKFYESKYQVINETLTFAVGALRAGRRLAMISLPDRQVNNSAALHA